MTNSKNQTSAQAGRRRAYNSPVREQQSTETREKIVAAGVQLVHALPAWDWKNLTASAVSEKADVSERTVRRYFTADSKLRDAVLKQLVEESGLDLDSLKLEEFGGMIEVLFLHLQSFTAKVSVDYDPTFESLDQKRRNGLFSAVSRATPGWSEEERETVTAILDVLWQPPLFERLTAVWGFDNKRAIKSLRWLFNLIHTAIQSNQRP